MIQVSCVIVQAVFMDEYIVLLLCWLWYLWPCYGKTSAHIATTNESLFLSFFSSLTLVLYVVHSLYSDTTRTDKIHVAIHHKENCIRWVVGCMLSVTSWGAQHKTQFAERKLETLSIVLPTFLPLLAGQLFLSLYWQHHTMHHSVIMHTHSVSHYFGKSLPWVPLL